MQPSAGLAAILDPGRRSRRPDERGGGRLRAARHLLVTLLVAAGLLAAPSVTQAGDLDQVQADTSGGGSEATDARTLAQTFTAGITGKLDRVDLFLTQAPTAGGHAPAIVAIESVSDGRPSDTRLTMARLVDTPEPDRGDFISVSIDPAVPVTAGTQYAITVSPQRDAHNVLWYHSGGDAYTRGSAYERFRPGFGRTTWESLPNDFAFITYVAVKPSCGQGVEIGAALIDGPDPVGAGQPGDWRVQLTLTACEDLADVSAQGGTPAWATTTPTTSDGTITTRKLNRNNQVLLWQVGDLAEGGTATAELIVTGTTGAKAACGTQIPLTGTWSTTATTTEPGATPVKYDQAGPVIVTIGGGAC